MAGSGHSLVKKLTDNCDWLDRYEDIRPVPRARPLHGGGLRNL